MEREREIRKCSTEKESDSNRDGESGQVIEKKRETEEWEKSGQVRDTEREMDVEQGYKKEDR
jgi:hypothetical protein